MDIIILGNGVIGLTMAQLLAKQHVYNITLIGPDTVQDQRYSAINHAAGNIFRHLELWEQIVAIPPGIYDQMYLLDTEHGSEVTIRASDLGAPQLGHVINNNVLINCLNQTMHNVVRINGMATRIEHSEGCVTVQVNNQIISGHLIIGADGANSWLRQQLQIANYSWDYKHHAIVATVELHEPHANVATQKFAPDGPLAFLPLTDPKLCSIVWSTSPQRAQTLMHMSDQEFAAELGVAQLCSSRVTFPLRMLHAQHYTTPHTVLIGDAAHVFHPLAGQGMNLGLLDAATLAECLQNTDAHNLHRALRKYERWRKTQAWGMIALMEGCKRLFETRNPVVNMLRGFGMQTLDKFVPGKNILAKAGMGVLGEIPSSARSYI